VAPQAAHSGSPHHTTDLSAQRMCRTLFPRPGFVPALLRLGRVFACHKGVHQRQTLSRVCLYVLRPDFAQVTWTTVLVAMGLAFFKLSVGMGTMITHGSYYRND